VPDERTPRAASTNGILYPLDLAYTQAGIAQPKVHEISPKDIPFRTDRSWCTRTT
jgi:hypothetical protein